MSHNNHGRDLDEIFFGFFHSKKIFSFLPSLFLLFNTFTMSGMLKKTKKTNFDVRACAMKP